MAFSQNLPNVLAYLMLGAMFLVLFLSAFNDSATMDELAHIPAAYSYVTLKDMRLNPEHPPLIKDLAGLGILFLRPNFPTNISSWQDDVNGQWTQGAIFLYESGNNPDKILLFGRFPIMLLALLFGWLLYRWTGSLYGSRVALLSLFFYALSPTFLAHSRYVTTDLAAAFGFFIGFATFFRFLERQNFKRLALAGLAFGTALLLKFSLFLLVPLYGLLAILWVFLQERENFDLKSYLKAFGVLFLKLIFIGLIGLALIWLVYAWHVANYPVGRQLSDSQFLLSSFGFRPIVNFDLWLVRSEIFRPLGQYLLGLLMVVQRSAGGNTTYYLGEVSAAGWRSYFPVAYLLKETIAFHLLTLLALFLALHKIKSAGEKSFDAVFSWTKDNFVLASSLIFIAFYWLYSIRSPLNIGVRHILPTFPFIYLLVAREIAAWLYRPTLEEPRNLGDWLRSLYRSFIEPIPRFILVALLMFWMIISTSITFPFYLSYYNEFVGIENGWRYIVDSNYDWGQDLKRLSDLAEKENINKIYLDYFGGGSPRYYLGERFEPWNSAKGPPPSGSYFALSATFLQGARGKPASGFVIRPEDTYSWLRGLEPLRRAGLSIFIYKIP